MVCRGLRLGGICVGALAVGVPACAPDPLQGASFASVAQSASDAAVLYTAANSVSSSIGIYRSGDSGVTWAPTPGNWWTAIKTGEPFQNPVTQVAVSPADTNVVLIATSTGDIFRSSDGGASWSQTDYGPNLPALKRLAFHPTRPDLALGVVYDGSPTLSTDGGRSWHAPTDPPGQTIWLTDFAFDPTDSNQVYGLCGGICVSEDAGSTWTVRTKMKSSPEAVVASPTEPGRLWVAADDGVWTSTDGGATLAKLTDWSLLSAWPDTPNGSFVIVERGAYLGDQTSALVVFGTDRAGVVGVHPDTGAIEDMGASLARRADEIRDVIVAPSGALRIATSATCRGLAGVFESNDRGASWTPLLQSSPSPALGNAIGDAVPHEVEVIFFRDVPNARQEAIFKEHNVVPQYPSLAGPLYWLQAPDGDGRSPSDLIREFQAVPEVDCVLNDFSVFTQ
jgi:photosystem II stability/assembly factor-like uncharacterized protein